MIVVRETRTGPGLRDYGITNGQHLWVKLIVDNRTEPHNVLVNIIQSQ